MSLLYAGTHPPDDEQHADSADSLGPATGTSLYYERRQFTLMRERKDP